MATYLVTHKADANLPDRSNWTPLMYAAWDDSPPLVTLLLGQGAKLDAVDNDGLDAARDRRPERQSQGGGCVDHGRGRRQCTGGQGWLHAADADLDFGLDARLATVLIEHGANVNATNPGGVTALMIAAADNHANIVELLLKSGADVNARSEDGRTALSIAEANSNDALVKLLRQAAQTDATKST